MFVQDDKKQFNFFFTFQNFFLFINFFRRKILIIFFLFYYRRLSSFKYANKTGLLFINKLKQTEREMQKEK